MGPGDLESMFIKTGGSETQEELKVEEVARESQGGAAVSSPGSQRKGEPRRQGRG